MPYDSYEHAGVIVEIVHDDDPMSPEENDNAGTLYSWNRYFQGDKHIPDPDLSGDMDVDATESLLPDYMAWHYDGALTIPLYYSDGGSVGARIYETNNHPNCALVFTQKEIDDEWGGHVDPYPITMRGKYGEPTGEFREYGGARSYAKGRIEELDNWLRGNVWGIVIKDPEGHELDSCWGFIGDPDSDWIREEANEMAVVASLGIKEEADEAFRWACADVMTT